MQYDASDVLFNVFPWKRISARHAAFLPAVLSGARLVIGERFSASRFWATAGAEEITAFNFMGAVCAMLLRQPADGRGARTSPSRSTSAIPTAPPPPGGTAGSGPGTRLSSRTAGSRTAGSTSRAARPRSSAGAA
jgi:hypothetical protein